MTVLSSGKMSRASGLSPKALRLYHSKGLLVPAHVDPTTGYRSYTPEQVDRGRAIVQLRRLEMPLARIAEVIDGPKETIRTNVLAWWEQRQREIADSRKVFKQLNERFVTDTHEAAWPHPVTHRSEPERKLATMVSQVDQSDLVGTFTADLLDIRARLSAQGGSYGDEYWVIYHTVVGPRVPGTIETCVPYGGQVDPVGPVRLRTEPARDLAFTPVFARQCQYPAILAAFDAVEDHTAQGSSGAPREVYPVPWTDEPDVVVAEVAVPIFDMY